jgi:hypothetical protein
VGHSQAFYQEFNQVNKQDKKQEKDDFAIEEWLNSITDDGVKIRILREKEDGAYAWVTSKKKSAITDEFLLGLGEGKYRIQALRSNGTIITVRTIEIDENPEKDPAVPVIDTDKPLLAVMQQSNSQLFQMLLAQMNATSQIVVAALTGNKSSGDPAQLLNAITGAMTNMKTLAGGDELDKIDKVLTIADRIGGNGGGSKSAVDHLMEMGKEILPMIMAGNAPRALPPARPNPPAPAPAEVPPGSLSGGSATVEGEPGAAPSAAELQIQISQLLAKLYAGADRNLEAHNVACMLLELEDLGDPAAAVIVETSIQTPFEEWAKRIGLEESRRPWFEKLFTTIKELTKEPAETEPEKAV